MRGFASNESNWEREPIRVPYTCIPQFERILLPAFHYALYPYSNKTLQKKKHRAYTHLQPNYIRVRMCVCVCGGFENIQNQAQRLEPVFRQPSYPNVHKEGTLLLEHSITPTTTYYTHTHTKTHKHRAHRIHHPAQPSSSQ